MKILYIVILLVGITSCKNATQDKSSIDSSDHVTLPDGTLAIDSQQGGSFELTILPSEFTYPIESNVKANESSKIELIINGQIKVLVSSDKVIRIQGLLPKKHSLVELVDGVQTSSFFVDGSKEPRMVADYYKTYGHWIVRTPY